jgi:hypothetical protein
MIGRDINELKNYIGTNGRMGNKYLIRKDL